MGRRYMSTILEFLRNRWEQFIERPALWWDEWCLNEKALVRERRYAEAHRRARNDAERADLSIENQDERDHDYKERELLASRRLRILAHRLRVPEPPLLRDDLKSGDFENGDWYNSDDWRQTGNGTGTFYLSPQGFKRLRDEVRQELLRRREVRLPWLSWLTGLTGLLGAATGLVTVWRAH